MLERTDNKCYVNLNCNRLLMKMIEKAISKDATKILVLINESNRDAFRKIIPLEYFLDPVLSLEELLDDFRRMNFYVFKDEDRIVGVAALHVEDTDVGKIKWVYILPEFQKRGIGTALIEHLESESKKIGLKKLWLRTLGDAQWAVSFYEKLGYMIKDKTERPEGSVVTMEKSMF